jgi:hypothetical protein
MRSNNSLSFRGKVVLITVAATVIGRAVAVAFAEHGANLVIGDVNEDAAAETMSHVNRVGCSPFDVAVRSLLPLSVGAVMLPFLDRPTGLRGAGHPLLERVLPVWHCCHPGSAVAVAPCKQVRAFPLQKSCHQRALRAEVPTPHALERGLFMHPRHERRPRNH